jgi:hypothetical protein
MRIVSFIAFFFSLLTINSQNNVILTVSNNFADQVEWNEKSQSRWLSKNEAQNRLNKLIKLLDHPNVSVLHNSRKDQNSYGIFEVSDKSETYRILYYGEKTNSNSYKIKKLKMVKKKTQLPDFNHILAGLNAPK